MGSQMNRKERGIQRAQQPKFSLCMLSSVQRCFGRFERAGGRI